jgi:hypothetical protein
MSAKTMYAVQTKLVMAAQVESSFCGRHILSVGLECRGDPNTANTATLENLHCNHILTDPCLCVGDRVARFFSVQDTKMGGGMYQMTTKRYKYTIWP